MRARYLVTLVVAAAVVEALTEPYRLTRRSVELALDTLPPSLDGYRIALIADFHYPRWASANLIRRAVTMGMKFEPDLFIFAGDFIDWKRPGPAPDLCGLFNEASAPDGVFGVFGDHDNRVDPRGVREQLARSTPIRLLVNEGVVIERNGAKIALGGIDDMRTARIDVNATFAGAPEVAFRVLISHHPDVAELHTSGERVDLQLSGHTHGGQIRIPFGPPLKVSSRYGRKYAAGLVRGPKHPVYITCGVASARHIRFWRPPEVSLLTLRSTAKERTD